MNTLDQHELSKAFPGMNKLDHAALTADILHHGQRDPITLFQGKVLDGWHRYTSCLELGEKPAFRTLDADIDPVAFVMSCNLYRRHLEGSQRANAVVACSRWAKSGENQHSAKGQEPGSLPKTNTEMAKEADVSVKTIQQAKKAIAGGLGDDVRDGKITVKKAAETVKAKTPNTVPNNGGRASLHITVSTEGEKPATGNPSHPEGMILVDEVENLQQLADLAELRADNAAMGKVFDADPDDRLAVSIDECEKLRKENAMQRTRIDSLMTEKNEAVKLLSRSKLLVGKLQRQIGKEPAVVIEVESDGVKTDMGGLPE